MSTHQYVEAGFYDDGYTADDVYVDWANRIIYVPKQVMPAIQLTPTEIRELDTDTFRLSLKDLEDSPEGMPYVDTHRHIAGVTVGGVTLARVVEIINDYTITFEDGQYAVNLTKSNNNIGDRVNVNQVSVRAANSAGLMQTREIEYNTFNGGVTIDLIRGQAGTAYPQGTPLAPVNNIADARFIAASRGFQTLYVIGNLTLDTGDDVSNFLIVGSNAKRTYLTILSPADTASSEIRDCTVTGVLDGGTIIRECYVENLSYVNGFIYSSELAGTITLGGGEPAQILDCYAEVQATTIDMGGSGQALNLQSFSGDVVITNKTGPDVCNIMLESGQVTLAASVTNGTGIKMAGIGDLVNESAITPQRNHMLSVESLVAYTATNPIAANVLRMNGAQVFGTGQSGDAWRGAGV
jgi:hypothetical protein